MSYDHIVSFHHLPSLEVHASLGRARSTFALLGRAARRDNTAPVCPLAKDLSIGIMNFSIEYLNKDSDFERA